MAITTTLFLNLLEVIQEFRNFERCKFLFAQQIKINKQNITLTHTVSQMCISTFEMLILKVSLIDKSQDL